MTTKILPAIVTGLLLATTALASAQTRSYQQAPQGYTDRIAPDRGVYWQDPQRRDLLGWRGAIQQQ